ncbi:DNA-binding transcriptional LysR family regulator [Bradyrhizobium algeriense]|uniref:DNA-binding transcriptional LysR family regulator n=1 Tax=Bradyrhizobium algeriense TaxID=634784 RepID=A0ABU8BDS3_9BRAD
MTLEIRHFRYFVAVAEEGHITRAAEKLGMQQPPLSQRIGFIEDKLGARLFLRRARGVELTREGRVFLEIARSLLSQHEGVFEAVRRAARGQTGRLCVGATPTSAFHPIVPLSIRSFRDEFPQVKLTLEERLPADLIKGLRDESIDVAFLRADKYEEDLAFRQTFAD